MYYLILYQVALNVAFIGFIVYEQKVIRSQKKRISGLHEEKQRLSLKVQKSLHFDQRSHFRLELPQKESKLIIESIDGDQSGKLQGKIIQGYIENISMSGIKFLCPYNLPVKSNIQVSSCFHLGTHEFCLHAVVVRKEETMKNKLNVYGLKFVQVPHREQERLNVEIRKIDSQKRNVTRMTS